MKRSASNSPTAHVNLKVMPRWNRPAAPVRILIHIITYLLGFTMLLPFLWMVSTSLKTRPEAIGGMDEAGNIIPLTLLPTGWPWQWHWSNYADAWQSAHLGDFYMNSVIVAVVVTAISLIHNALAGFAFAKLRFKGRKPLFFTMLATMMLPFQVYFIFAYLLCGWLNYNDSFQSLIVPFLASAFGIYYMRQAVEAVPDDLLDAGRVDGLTDFELFWHLVRPSITPAIAALAIFTFMAHWNSFFWPLIVIDSNDMYTLPLAVRALAGQYYTQSWPVQMAAATIITVPVVLVFLVFQRRFVEGITLTGLKG